MTTGYMSIEEHAQAARTLLQESDLEYEVSGATLQSSEKMWGAACHALIARAKQQEWTVGSHRALVNASQLLTREQGDEWVSSRFPCGSEVPQQVLWRQPFRPFCRDRLAGERARDRYAIRASGC